MKQKWNTPKIIILKVIKTLGGQPNQSEGYIKPNGQPQPGRVS